MFEIFLIVWIVVLLLFLLGALIALVKNEITVKQQMRIIDAIRKYNHELIKNGRELESKVDYTDIEDYDSTYKRWWDWGYKRILPPDKLEIIKPYIK